MDGKVGGSYVLLFYALLWYSAPVGGVHACASALSGNHMNSEENG